MLWLLLVGASTYFGFQVVPRTRVTNLNFFPRIFTGWLLGSTISGLILSVTTMIIPLSFFHTLILFAGLIAGSIALNLPRKASLITFETNPFFVFFILLTAGLSLRYSSQVFRYLPHQLPPALEPIYATEISFIHSVLEGCNRRHSFLFKNPLISGQRFHGYPIPLLFTAACMTWGASFGDISIIISFLNTVSTAYAVYAFARKFTKWPTVSSLLFLFSGSWAGFIYFRAVNRQGIENDLVHQFLPTHESVWFQTFASLLTLSKSSSYAIALTQYGIFWGPSLLAGLLAALIPSVATSFAFFGFMAGFGNSLFQVLPFAISLCVRLRPFIWVYKPLFREAEMRGTFFAPLVIWFLAMGPIFVVVFFFFWVFPKDRLKHYLFASLGPFLILQFLREGTDHFQNAVAITAVVFPFVVIFCTELLRKFTLWPTDLEYQGSALFIATATIAFMLFGGYVCASRISGSHVTLFSKEDLQLVNWISKGVTSNAVVLGHSAVLHPLVLTGRQQFMADGRLLWKIGFPIAQKLDQIDRLIGTTAKKDWNDLGVGYVVESAREAFQVKVSGRIIHQNERYRLSVIE